MGSRRSNRAPRDRHVALRLLAMTPKRKALAVSPFALPSCEEHCDEAPTLRYPFARVRRRQNQAKPERTLTEKGIDGYRTFLLMQSPSAHRPRKCCSRYRQAQAAESLGFRNVWLGSITSRLTVTFSVRSVRELHRAKTTKLRFGTAVIVVPLHHPLLIAEETRCSTC